MRNTAKYVSSQPPLDSEKNGTSPAVDPEVMVMKGGIGTTLVVGFERDSPMHSLVARLNEEMTKILKDNWYPQQNVHFTLAAGIRDLHSAEQFNFINSNALLVEDLESKVRALRAEVKSMTEKALPPEWRNFFLTVGQGVVDKGLRSHTALFREATSLLGKPGYPLMPAVQFEGLQLSGSGALWVIVEPVSTEDVELTRDTWDRLWKHVGRIHI